MDGESLQFEESPLEKTKYYDWKVCGKFGTLMVNYTVHESTVEAFAQFGASQSVNHKNFKDFE